MFIITIIMITFDLSVIDAIFSLSNVIFIFIFELLFKEKNVLVILFFLLALYFHFFDYSAIQFLFDIIKFDEEYHDERN